jgi:hypothetical protein
MRIACCEKDAPLMVSGKEPEGTADATGPGMAADWTSAVASGMAVDGATDAMAVLG